MRINENSRLIRLNSIKKLKIDYMESVLSATNSRLLSNPNLKPLQFSLKCLGPLGQ